MTRPMTRLEAVELIEQAFNLDSEEAYERHDDPHRGTFEFRVLDRSRDKVEHDIETYCDFVAGDIDPETIVVRDDVAEGPIFECVAVTIRTREHHVHA